MLLEVDIESNQILFTEPLVPQAVDNVEARRDSEIGPSMVRRWYGPPHYYVFCHFLVGLLALFALAVIVALAFRDKIVHCDSARISGSFFRENDKNNILFFLNIPGNITNCNSVTDVDKPQ